jgi:DNA-binding NtrC family response regulator
MKTKKILLVDDEEATIFGYSSYLSKQGYITKKTNCLRGAKELVSAEHFDAVLLDLRLPDGNAIEWINELHTRHTDTAIIVITGNSDIPTAVKAMKLGAHNYLTKPINMENLVVSLNKSIEIEELKKRETIYQRLAPQKTEPFFGSSPVIEKMLQYAKVAAANHTVILLLGETGTGKGVLARWIHEHSPRKNDMFIELNCSSLKGELLRSELYGHTRGAFTSAIKDREGLIEIADHGTLFLDEIGDMDLEVQAELLKTIEEKTFRRIGENKVRTSDFRLICATNRDLTGASRSGTFRQDLYYRICIFPISLPSLRERREDIPGMLDVLLSAYGLKDYPIDQKAIGKLMNYSWPGNIRELKNMIERALLLAQGEPLSEEHFPGLMTEPEQKKSNEETWNLEEIEHRHIVKALKYFKGDKTETSNALGISLASLYRRIEKIDHSVTA